MTDHKLQENSFSSVASNSQEDELLVSKSSMDLFSDVTTEKECSNFSFSFLGQDFRDIKRISAETKDSAFVKTDFSPNVLKYQFSAGNNVLGFMEEPQTMSFTVQEMFVGSVDGRVSQSEGLHEHHRYSDVSSHDDSVSQKTGFCITDNKVDESSVEEGQYEQDMLEFSAWYPHEEEILREKEAFVSSENKFPIHEETDDNDASYEEDISYEVQQQLPRHEFSSPDLNPDSKGSSDGMIEVPCSMITDDLKPEVHETDGTPQQVVHDNIFTDRESSVNEDTEEDADDEYIELKPPSNDANEVTETTCLSWKDANFVDVKIDRGKETELMDEESFVKGSMDSDSDVDEDEFDILLEHQQLVKQMKMERKNSMVKGLPTISEEEECETPKILESLKPIKIEDKFEFKDVMEEIQKFYKSYAEKMRKLDILNYQTLHAISFLQLKDSQLFMSSKKTLMSSLKPFTLPSFSVFKQQRIHADPALKSIYEMHKDLELVYVGQICLSWEILLWQYGKVKELVASHGSEDSHSYNQVAGEYQQFQVLLQRFLEDEKFQGPRIQHYVKSRCLFRGLLQVPCIKDDCAKNKTELVGEEVGAISITVLADTIKEAMQTFWDFIHADKEEASGLLGEIQSPEVSGLLMNVKTCLGKKEKKIKEVQRSGNCIVKKFQKHHRSLSTALLISQVELKLVARVLNMSRLTTDYLVWCQKKLDNISIANRKVGIEPAFLLFPC
ncbi:OLC1v1032792C2 [Oldenlandia corymbosa var. corymbosa]|nr:OLC1v1032792C2 [Oldenlandia corymbosa var. corymbosa]